MRPFASPMLIGGTKKGWQRADAGFGTTIINSVAYGNGVWVAVGQAGRIMTATSLVGPWTSRGPAGYSGAFTDVAYGNGVWVAVGSAAALYTATNPNGTWTARTSGFTGDGIQQGINCVAYGNGVWVIAGNYGHLRTATNPTGTWTSRTSGFPTSTGNFDGTINAVAYGAGDGAWVIVGNRGNLASTTSPTSAWTLRTVGSGTAALSSVAYGNGIWVATPGSGGRIITASSHGGPWALRTLPGIASGPTRVTFGSGSSGPPWVGANSNNVPFISTSNPIGLWTEGSFIFGNILTNVAYGNSTFVAVGWNGSLAYLEVK